MGYRMYMGGSCSHCQKPLGLIEVYGGRVRSYCNDACRKAASRERLKRDKAVSRNELLVEMWEEHGISGERRRMLEDILIKYGKDAATLATEAVIAARKEDVPRELVGLRQSYADLMFEYNYLKTAKALLEQTLSRLESKGTTLA